MFLSIFLWAGGHIAGDSSSEEGRAGDDDRYQVTQRDSPPQSVQLKLFLLLFFPAGWTEDRFSVCLEVSRYIHQEHSSSFATEVHLTLPNLTDISQGNVLCSDTAPWISQCFLLVCSKLHDQAWLLIAKWWFIYDGTRTIQVSFYLLSSM